METRMYKHWETFMEYTIGSILESIISSVDWGKCCVDGVESTLNILHYDR